MKKINYHDVTVDYLNDYGVSGEQCNDIIVDDDTDIVDVYSNLSQIMLTQIGEDKYTYTDEDGEERVVIVVSEKQIEVE